MGFPPQGYTPISVTRATYIDMIPGIVTDTEIIPGIEDETDKIPDVEHETEWSTDPVVDTRATIAETELTTHTIAAADFVYPSGATELRVMLLAMITAQAQGEPDDPHHIGIKVQREINDTGWDDIDGMDFTANPPLGLAAEGAMATWSVPIDISALVESGDKLEFRFAVDSNDAASVNYTTSFLVVLVYKMG